MAKAVKSSTRKNKAVDKRSKSFSLASAGVTNIDAFAALMMAVSEDAIMAKLSPPAANAACNAAGKAIKAVELKYKYGTPGARGKRVLNLVLAK